MAPMSTKSVKRKTGEKSLPAARRASKLPRATRPIVPATYGFPTGPQGLLDWKWARERLTNSHNYVIITVRPDGRPHAMGMHGLWIKDAFYFGTAVETRKAKNLAVNANCILVNDRLDELVVVEGTAKQVTAADLPMAASQASKRKYGWPMRSRSGAMIFKVTPRVVFGFPEKQIATAVTRWIFD